MKILTQYEEKMILAQSLQNIEEALRNAAHAIARLKHEEVDMETRKMMVKLNTSSREIRHSLLQSNDPDKDNVVWYEHLLCPDKSSHIPEEVSYYDFLENI